MGKLSNRDARAAGLRRNDEVRLINAAVVQTYTPTNVTTDRSYDADSTTLAEVADVLGSLIADLQNQGLLK